MKNDSLLSIGALAKRTGIQVSAIRFYADKKLIPSFRNASGQRVFQKSVIRRVSFILISQQLGYSLKEVAVALETLPNNRTPNKEDWSRLSKKFSENIDRKIERLQRLKDTLTGCIGCGCLSLKACHLYNPEDKAHKLGSGPRIYMGDKPTQTI